jgi:hypothetical protein
VPLPLGGQRRNPKAILKWLQMKAYQSFWPRAHLVLGNFSALSICIRKEQRGQ